MGQKNAKGSVSVVNADGRIRLRWRYQRQRYSLNLFQFNKVNLQHAKKIALQIENDLLHGSFDVSLVRYKPSAIQDNVAEQKKTLVEYFEEWVKNYRNMDCDRDIDYHSTRSMMRRWGHFDDTKVVEFLASEAIGARTYNRRLTMLKAFFNWTTKQQITGVNPLDDVLPKKTKKVEKASRKPFTEEEMHHILEAFKNDTFCQCTNGFMHSHYYPFVYFVLATGARNGEVIGLRVQHVDLTNNLVHIKEALSRTLKGTNASARIRKETKNGKERVVPLTTELREVLIPLLLHKEPEDLVFLSPKGMAIDDNQFQKRVFRKVLQKLDIEHRNLYACRHTAVSRWLHAGIAPVTAAFMLGNNPQTLLRHYAHLVSLPAVLPKVL